MPSAWAWRSRWCSRTWRRRSRSRSSGQRERTTAPSPTAAPAASGAAGGEGSGDPEHEVRGRLAGLRPLLKLDHHRRELLRVDAHGPGVRLEVREHGGGTRPLVAVGEEVALNDVDRVGRRQLLEGLVVRVLHRLDRRIDAFVGRPAWAPARAAAVAREQDLVRSEERRVGKEWRSRWLACE